MATSDGISLPSSANLPGPPGGRPRRFFLRWIAGAGVAVSAAIWGWSIAVSSPAPPTVATSGLDPAIADLILRQRAIVSADLHSGEAWGHLGLALFPYGFAAEAKECFAQAEKRAPRDPRWSWFQALLLLPGNEGMEKLRRTVEICGNVPDTARLRWAEELANRGQWVDADRNYRALLLGSTNHPRAFLGLARVAQARGQLQDAVSLLRPCQVDERTARSAYELLANLQERLGQPAAAEAAHRVAATVPPDREWADPWELEASQYRVGRRAWLDQAQVLLRRGRTEEAFPIVSNVVARYPDSADGWLVLGRLRILRHEFSDAETALRESLRHETNSVDAQAQLAFALIAQQRLTEAEESIRRALALKPDFAEGHYQLGFILMKTERYEEAAESFRRAVRSKRDWPEAHLALAEALKRGGRVALAIETLRDAIGLMPENEQVKLRLRRLEQEVQP